MNKILLDDLCSRHKNIWMGIADFTDLLRFPHLLSPICDKDVLISGLYGYIGETKIYVTKLLSKGEYSFAETRSDMMKECGFTEGK